MSPATSQSALAASIPRAVFSFGTQTYTAIQTAGPNEAVIGKMTITAGGQALQLNGGYASLASNGLVYKGGSIQPTTTASSTPSVVTGGRVVLSLASTTLTAVALSDGSIAGSETIGASDFEWVIGQQTLTPISDGIVVESGTEKQTYTYQLTNITQGLTPVTRTTTLESLETIPLPTRLETSTSLKSSETTPLPSSTTARTTSSSVASTVTETATVTATPSKASSMRGATVAWTVMALLLVGFLAT